MNINEKVIQYTKTPLSRVTLSYLPHSFVSSPILTTEYENNENDKTFFNTNPVPIFLPKMDTLPPDIFLKPVLEKDKWISDINRLKRRYKRTRSITRLKSYKQIRKEKIIPQYLVDFYDLLQNDPDIYFNGIYNWYHTNGSLDVQDFRDEKFIFHATGSTQNILNISKLVHKKKNSALNLHKFHSENTENTIFETRSRNINNELYIYNRFKSEFSINNLQFCNDTPRFNWICRKKSIIPLSSACVNFYNLNNYCLVDVNRSMNIYDINTDQNTPILLNDPTTIDAWSTIIYTDICRLLYLDRKNLVSIDTRDNKHIETKITLPSGLLNSCDYNSFVEQNSLQNNQYFIGTYHSIYLIDLRNNKKIVKKWTHMMNAVPFIGKSNNSETLCIASSLPSEKMLFKDNMPHFILNSLYDTKNELQLKGNCLNPKSSINKRINYSTTGLAITNIDNVSYVLSQNALGDIYAQKYSDHALSDDSFIKHEFKRELEKKLRNNEPLKLTHEINMEHLLTDNRNQLKSVQKIVNKRKKDENNWCQSIEELKQYKDLLAQTTLCEWGYDVDEVNGVDKVTSWLSDINTSVESPQTQDKELNELSLQTQDVFSTKETIDNVFGICQTPKSTKVVKRRYVSGF